MAALVARFLDDALRQLELRRYRRILLSARLPILYAVAVFAVAGMAVPFVFAEGGLLAGRNPISRDPAWGAAALLTVTALAAGAGAYFRSQYLWNQERRMQTLPAWLLTGQEPGRAVRTAVLMAALLGLTLVAAPALFGLALGVLQGLAWWQLLLYAGMLPLCAGLGAAVGAVVFFGGQSLLSRPQAVLGGILATAAAGGIWLRLEAAQNGWARGWEEHPARLAQALEMLTPAPYLMAIGAPGWWRRFTEPTLDLRLPAWEAALLYALFLAAATAYLTWMAANGYRRLAADPDLIEEKPRLPTEEGGREYYWRGFRNPVWTRDMRTRLRSRETAEFIFFASLAVAAGAFVPLVLTARDLSDPLQTARAARQIFFWLTMTLVAIVTLITPSLTADSLVQERQGGALEMLIGTSLRPRDILLGKLLGAVCVMLLLISPSLPLFGLCYLFHGASGGQVVGVYALLVVTLVLSAFLGLAQSAINPRAGMAKFWAYALTGLLVGFPGGPFWIAAALTAPEAQMRHDLTGNFGVTAMLGLFWLFGLGLMWGNASEQLEYSEA
jgi:hypothetical protein